MVRTPDNAVVGAGAATLTVDAVTGPPNNKTAQHVKVMDVGAAPTPPSTRNVSFTLNSGDISDHNVTPSIGIEYAFTAIYNTTPATPATFKATLSVASETEGIAGWGANIHDLNPTFTPQGSDPIVVTTPEITIDPGASGQMINFVVFTPPATGNPRRAKITMRIEATDDATIDDEKSWKLTVP